MTLKAGIVGCGQIACSKYIASLEKIKEVQVVALYDTREEQTRKAASLIDNSDVTTFTDYQKMLEQDLDIIYVCTPNRSHASITIDALKAGKHVMCEKPMAFSYAEALEMIRAAKENKKLLSIGYQNRFRPDSLYLKKACESGELGDIYYAKAKAIRRRGVPTWGVFLDKEQQGGGPLIDIGTHALDLTLWLMNNYRVKYVVGTCYHKLNHQTQTGNAFGDWDPEKFKVEDSAFGFIVMENGATVTLEASWALNTLDVQEAKTVLCGTKAGADMEQGLRINGIKHNSPYVRTVEQAVSGVDFNVARRTAPEVLEQQTFVDAVLGRGELTVLPEQAATVTRILEAIYESARIGKPVYFDTEE